MDYAHIWKSRSWPVQTRTHYSIQLMHQPNTWYHDQLINIYNYAQWVGSCGGWELSCYIVGEYTRILRFRIYWTIADITYTVMELPSRAPRAFKGYKSFSVPNFRSGNTTLLISLQINYYSGAITCLYNEYRNYIVYWYWCRIIFLFHT